jgi:hypothetical protein
MRRRPCADFYGLHGVEWTITEDCVRPSRARIVAK